MRFPRSCVLVLAAIAAWISVDRPVAAESRVFLIGNSLTWDTQPSRLSGDVQWHVDCGKSLPYIFDHPKEPCVKSSTLWPIALKQKQYEFLVLQTHYGATLAEEVRVISEWVRRQPTAIIVIHTGWARSATRAAEYANQDEGEQMQHSPIYVRRLLAMLRKQHPGREFRQTHAMDLLHKVAQDATAGKGPFADVAELYRDKIHMNLKTGRYLMHNAMRHALGQSRSQRGFEQLDPQVRRYLDSVLQTLPELR